jgi:carboxylesterase
MLLPLAAVATAAYAARALVARRTERTSAARLRPGADGIVPGAGPIELEGRGRGAALLLHGFGDTPQTLTYLAEHLNAQGWAVRAPLLPGHGRSLRAFAESRAEHWLSAAREGLAAMRARHGPVALVGLSMGGALATILAAEQQDTPAIALVAPYLSMPTLVQRVARAHHLCTPFAPYLAGRGERSIHDPSERPKNLAYGMSTPRLLFELLQVVRLARAAAPQVGAPTLVVQSREDNRIPADAGERAYALFQAPVRRLVWLEGCGHLITVDYGRDRVFAAVEEWLGEHAPPGGAVDTSAPDSTPNGVVRRALLRQTPA